MKIRLAFFLCFLLLLISQPAHALRCHGSLVSIGNTKSEVVNKCGEPEDIVYWTEERLTGNRYYYRYRHDSSGEKKYKSYGYKEIVEVEEWTYNFGPHRFMRHLIFVKGRVSEFKSGRKGY